MNYSIIKELGQGGMATVFLAEDKKFQTQVALKVLNKDLAHNENIRKRFLAEARNMYKMSHPNIIKVTDLIDEGDTVAFVMEHIDGETLKEFLDRKGKLTDDEIRNIFSQMLEAVGYVHEQGLIHRDIKPSNFMIDKKGKVKLLDFGIAKNTDSSSAEYTQTGTGMQMGTPMYMSPEQITETKSVTPQSDIYSLGVVLWQLVTGEKPYNTATLSTFQLQVKIVNEPLALTGTAFDAVIKKATEKDPQHRFNSTADFFRDAKPAQVQNDSTVIYNSAPGNEQTVISLGPLNTANANSYASPDTLFEISVLDKNNELKFGFVNSNNIQVIPAIYEEVKLFENDIIVRIGGKYGSLDYAGNFNIPPIYEILSFSEKENIYYARLAGKAGFLDKRGNWIIQPLYESAFTLSLHEFFSSDGLLKIRVHENGEIGLIDRKGMLVLKPAFFNIHQSVSDKYIDQKGFIRVEVLDEDENCKMGFVNTYGKWIINPDFDNIEGFYENDTAVASIDDCKGIIDRKGNWLVEADYWDLEYLQGNLFIASENGTESGIIDSNGNWLVMPKFYSIIRGNNNTLIASVEKNGQIVFGVIDFYGNWIIKPLYRSDITYIEKNDSFLVNFNDKFGFLDRRGNWITQPVFDSINLDQFDEKGFIIAEINHKLGYIDLSGNWTIPPIYDELFGFDDNNNSCVRIGDKYGLISINGNWVIQPIFDYLSTLKLKSQTYYRAFTGNSYGYINGKGSIIIPVQYVSPEEAEGNIADIINNAFDNWDN